MGIVITGPRVRVLRGIPITISASSCRPASRCIDITGTCFSGARADIDTTVHIFPCMVVVRNGSPRDPSTSTLTMMVMMFATVTTMMMMMMMMVSLLFLKSTLGEGSLGVHPHRVHLVVKAFDELPSGNELGL